MPLPACRTKFSAIQPARTITIFMEFAESAQEREVPDPYYGGARGFEQVLDMAEDAAQGLLRHIRGKLPG